MLVVWEAVTSLLQLSGGGTIPNIICDLDPLRGFLILGFNKGSKLVWDVPEEDL